MARDYKINQLLSYGAGWPAAETLLLGTGQPVGHNPHMSDSPRYVLRNLSCQIVRASTSSASIIVSLGYTTNWGLGVFTELRPVMVCLSLNGSNQAWLIQPEAPYELDTGCVPSFKVQNGTGAFSATDKLVISGNIVLRP